MKDLGKLERYRKGRQVGKLEMAVLPSSCLLAVSHQSTLLGRLEGKRICSFAGKRAPRLTLLATSHWKPYSSVFALDIQPQHRVLGARMVGATTGNGKERR